MTIEELLDDPEEISLNKEMKQISDEMAKNISMQIWHRLCHEWQFRAEELVSILHNQGD